MALEKQKVGKYKAEVQDYGKRLGKKVQTMIEKELKIRDVCGDYALDIPDYNGSNIEIDGSKPNEATVCDMQEIKHGKWVSTGNALGYTEYHCSECNNYLFLDSKDSQLYPYCPYCGAKMKKE